MSRTRSLLAGLGAVALALSIGACSAGGEAAERPVDEATTTAPTTTPSTAPVPPPAPFQRVLTLGDSGMVDASGPIQAVFASGGATDVRSGAEMGFGLTAMNMDRTPSYWEQDWAADVDALDPQLSIVMLGGWDLWYIDQNGTDAYAAVVGRAVDLLSSRGGKVMWLSMLPGGAYGEATDTVNGIMESVAASRPDAVTYLDISPSLEGPAGDYPGSFVDDEGHEVKLRKLDYWHLCQDGAARLAAMVHERAVELGYAGPALAPWEDLGWRDDIAFESPACWPRKTAETPTPVP